MIESVQDNGGENVKISYKGTGQNSVSFTHSTNASGIQFACDENEHIPSRLGTTCVSGMLTCVGNISCTNITCNTIQYNTITQPAIANYIGYTNMSLLSSPIFSLMYGIYNNIISTTLPYAGTYDCDVSFPYSFVTGSAANNIIQYCISTNSSTPDSGVSNYISTFNVVPSFPNGLMAFTFRRIIYVSSSTTKYFVVYFSGGANNYGVINQPTYLRYTRIA